MSKHAAATKPPIPRIPHLIDVDPQGKGVRIDGLPFTYPIAYEPIRAETSPEGACIVWLPLLCDTCLLHGATDRG